MKTVVSLFLVALSLLAEISAVAGNHWCEIERAKMETSESSETSETLVSLKIKTQVRKIHLGKPTFLALTYNATDVFHNTSLASNLLFNQHLLKQRTSPIYLNNSVFLI